MVIITIIPESTDNQLTVVGALIVVAPYTDSQRAEGREEMREEGEHAFGVGDGYDPIDVAVLGA
jgi:hypothetical protein